jgi:hypothetical protein
MSRSMKRMLSAAVLVLFCLALCRAAVYRFREKEEAIRKACIEDAQRTGLPRDALKAKYPTPEIHLTSGGCVLPGGTGEVVVKGKFAPGTRFIFEDDNLEVVKESLVGGEYRATLKAATGIGPQSAGLLAITPVTALTVHKDNAVQVGGRYEWTMQAGNGWRVVARSQGGQTCAATEYGAFPYELLFYRPGETSPFEKRSAKLYHSLWERTNYRLSISQEDSAADAGMQGYTDLARKLSDPKLTNAQRQQVMVQLQQAQAAMMANVKKMSDPAYIQAQQAKRLEFGCERIDLEVPPGSNFKGEMRCAEKVGTRIPITGAMEPF